MEEPCRALFLENLWVFGSCLEMECTLKQHQITISNVKTDGFWRISPDFPKLTRPMDPAFPCVSRTSPGITATIAELEPRRLQATGRNLFVALRRAASLRCTFSVLVIAGQAISMMNLIVHAYNLKVLG